MGIAIPAKNTEHGIRAVTGDEVIEPESVRRYLRSKFGDNLDTARSAMRKLARAFNPQELAREAFGLHEQFRPEIPAGEKGWGAKGALDLGRIEDLAKREGNEPHRQLLARLACGACTRKRY